MDAKLQYPIRECFYYDAYKGQWFAAPEDENDEVNPATDVSLIFPALRRIDRKPNGEEWVVWCQTHQRYEPWKKDAPDSCCKLKLRHCILDEKPKASAMIRASGLWRWMIIQDSLEGELQIVSEWLSVGWEKKFIWKRMSSVLIPQVKIDSASYRVKLSEKETTGNCGHDRRRPPAFPRVLSKRLFAILSESMSLIYKRHILIPQCIDEYGMGINDVWRIVRNPNDVHISYLENFLGKAYYAEHVSQNCIDNYPTICAYLDIDPPKSVRKEYLKDPFSIIVYFWLVRLGFQDINAMRLFFCPAIMGHTNFYNVWFDPEYRLIRNFTLPCTRSGMDFVFYVRWMLRNGKDEMPLAKQIVKLMSERWEQWHDDTLRMFHEYFPFISEDTKQIVKRRGISGESHDALVHESFSVDMKRVNITYQSPMILRLDSVVLGFTFHVVTDTSELPVIGRKLSNCVASYSGSMSKKQCLIVTASDEKDYQACIEVSIAGKNKDGLVDRLRVVQCLGRFNRRLQGDILHACRQWVQQNQIEIGCMDI